MMYSAAMFRSAEDSLEQAQLYKLQRICEKLDLQPDDHLLEIGTGWGSMALYAASHYGCRVTTTTLSREQYEYTRQRIEAQACRIASPCCSRTIATSRASTTSWCPSR